MITASRALHTLLRPCSHVLTNVRGLCMPATAELVDGIELNTGRAVNGTGASVAGTVGSTCFPHIERSDIIPDTVTSVDTGLTFPQLRYMLTGRCPKPLSPRATLALTEWRKLHADMVAGRRPMRALVSVCMRATGSESPCGGHADRLKVWIAMVLWVVP